MPQSDGEVGCCEGNVLAWDGLQINTQKNIFTKSAASLSKITFLSENQQPGLAEVAKGLGVPRAPFRGLTTAFGAASSRGVTATRSARSGHPRAAACPRGWRRRALLRALGRLPHRQPAGRPHFPAGAGREGSRREGRAAEPPRRASCSQQRREPPALPPAKVSRGRGKRRPRRSGREEVWRRPAAVECNDSGAGAGSSGGPRSGRGTPACRRAGAGWGERGSPTVRRVAPRGASDGGRGRGGWRRYVAVGPRVLLEEARTACCLHGNAADVTCTDSPHEVQSKGFSFGWNLDAGMPPASKIRRIPSHRDTVWLAEDRSCPTLLPSGVDVAPACSLLTSASDILALVFPLWF